MDFSADDIQQLSPDDASLKAARGLVNPAKWPLLGVNDQAFWGECQGSGSRPYQVQVDKSGPAFKCSCPSRKFPCKHGLALLLLHVQKSEKFSGNEPPDWVTGWLATRQEKAEKKAVAEPPQADPEVKAKREALRRQRLLAGLQELELWLKDQIRHGLARLASETGFSQSLAARMIDAQLPGVARRVSGWPAIVASNSQWPAILLAEFGEMQLLIDGFRRIDELPEPLQADLQTTLGWAADKEAIIAGGEKINDDWLVLGQRTYEEDRLWLRRVWLYATTSRRFAFLLDFSHGNRQFEHVFITGSCVGMTLAYYPGNASMRALLVDKPQVKKPEATKPELPDEMNLTDALRSLAERLAANPWQKPLPMFASNMLVHHNEKSWLLVSESDEVIPVRMDAVNAWHLLAEAGGKPVQVFGEWDGHSLLPLGVWHSRFLWSNAS